MHIIFYKPGSFTFLVKDLFSQIQGFNAQNCKIHIPKTVASFRNIALVLVLDYERNVLSNAVIFLYL